MCRAVRRDAYHPSTQGGRRAKGRSGSVPSAPWSLSNPSITRHSHSVIRHMWPLPTGHRDVTTVRLAGLRATWRTPIDTTPIMEFPQSGQNWAAGRLVSTSHRKWSLRLATMEGGRRPGWSRHGGCCPAVTSNGGHRVTIRCRASRRRPSQYNRHSTAFTVRSSQYDRHSTTITVRPP